MRFLAHIQQSGEGCDYTIGCGHKVKIVEADTIEAAAHDILGAPNEYGDWDGYGNPRLHGPSGEAALKSITLYEIANVTTVDLDAHWRVCTANEVAKKRAAVEANERAEYERLQKKFAGGK